MEVRHVEGESDVRELIRAHGLAWRAAYDEILPSEILPDQPVEPSEEAVQRWEEDLRDNREGVLVAVDDEDVVHGFADIRWGESETKAFVNEDEAGLKAIYVEPDWWGEGMGTALLERGLEVLPESTEAVRLEMFAENDTARQFYEARGFEQTDTSEYELAGESYPTTIYTRQL